MTLLNINRNSKDIRGILVVPEKVTLNLPAIISRYLQPLGEFKNKVLVVGVFLPNKGALKKSIADEEISEIKEVAETYEVKNIFIANADYMKFFLKLKKKPAFERSIGSVFKGEDGYRVLPVININVLSFQPMKKGLLQTSVDTMLQVMEGTYVDNKEEFLESLGIKLCKSFSEAHKCLKDYMKCEAIAVDIETTHLRWFKADLLTIAFSKDDESGFAIALHPKYSKDWEKNRKLVKSFFENYKGIVIGHNFSYDSAILVYHFWMEHLTDTKNMIKGINYFNMIDTMHLAYLCINNIDRSPLGLKELVFSKFGNYDKGIEQKNLIDYPFDDVGRYNVLDTISTYWLYNKYSKKLIEEEQEDLYFSIYKPLLPAVIKMKMNGITIDMEKVKVLEEEISKTFNKNLAFLNTTEEVKETVALLKEEAEKKGKRQSEINKITFNPKSTNHLRVLLFDVMGFKPVKISKTSGLPSTDKEVISNLAEEANEEQQPIMKAIQEISETKTIYSTFVKGFIEKSVQDKFGNYKLFPEFSLTNTISGRMAGSVVNLLNIPSKGDLGKAIKKTIIAPKDYLILQIDSDNLEDKLITTKSGCKNKARIFTEGLDAHNFHSLIFYKEEFEKRGIKVDINDIELINSVKKIAPDLRQASKKYTFKEAYQGITEFHDRYVDMYKEIFEYRDKVERQLLEKGFTVGFFGLKARANLKDIKDKAKYQSVLRTMFNQTIQSGALIISRALFLLQNWIEKKGYEEKIKITNSVYDSIYIEVVNNPKIIYELNQVIVDYINPDYRNFTELEQTEIYIPLSATSEIGHSWVAEKEIPNDASLEEVKQILEEIS